jgi:general secretion pathway protein A
VEHLHHFRLNQDPFQNEPDLRFYFDSATHREAQLRVERGLRQNKGLTVLSGAGGTGKTLLARRILEALEEELFEASLMVMLPGATAADAVLARFARQIGVEEPAGDRAVLLPQIYERLAIVREDGRHTVLILDDAQILSQATMAEIGGLLNLDYEDRRLMSLLMVGLPELDVAISHDKSLSQRIDVRVRLESLDLGNAQAYLLHRLALVGGDPDIFGEDTIQALFKFGRGRPRLLNTLADNGLFEAYLGGRRQVIPSDVERAAADLGIGPDPGSTYTAIGGAGVGSASAGSDASLAALGESSGFNLPGDSEDPVAPVPGEFTDPDAGPAIDLPEIASPDETSKPELDLGDLLDTAGPVEEELTTVLNGVGPSAGGTRDLDAEVEAVLAEPEPTLDDLMRDPALDAEGDAFPVFEAEQTSPIGQAEATCLVFPDEVAQEDDGSEEIDDLFVELIDD